MNNLQRYYAHKARYGQLSFSFDEAQHARDADGKFTSGSGEAKKPKKEKADGEDGIIGSPTLSRSETMEAFIESTVPDGWFVHGRKSNGLSENYVTQLTRNIPTAIQYADKSKGSIWFIRPGEGAKVADMTDPDLLREIYESVLSDLKSGTLSEYPETEELLSIMIDESENQGEDEDELFERFEESANPYDIVDTAGFFDVPDFAQWMLERHGYQFAIVNNDGAIAIDQIDGIDAIRIPDDWKNEII